VTPAEVVSEAERLAASGALANAASLLQSALRDLPRAPENRVHRAEAYKVLLKVLHAQSREGRMLRLLRDYIAEYETADSQFDPIYETALLATKTSPTPLRRRERFRILVGQLERALHVDGQVAECGCAQGLSSFVLCSRLRRENPQFDGAGYEIYDSFKGLSEPVAEDQLPAKPETVHAPTAEIMTAGRFAASLDRVKNALRGFPGIAYFPGWIPAAFDTRAEKRYRFVHVDVDLYQPTKDSFEYFWPRLVPGGVMVCDDYNWPGARRAVEEFCGAAGIRFEVTPQQQACFARPA
jgi:hypothetical protein